MSATLDLNFTTGALDPRITFTRTSIGTYFDAAGVLQTAASGVPRFDHNPATGEALGLLIEEARTNLLLRSAEFDVSPWGNINTPVITANSTVAPDGTTTADTIQDDNTAAHEARAQSAAIAADTVIRCASVFIKKDMNTTRFPGIHFVMGVNRYRLKVNTETGQVSNYTGTLPTAFGSIDAGAYWRIWIAGANSGAGTAATLEIYPALSTLFDSSEQVTATASVIAWGAQVEVGSFPTSYIPTTTASVARVIDVPSIPHAGWWNATAGTFYLDYRAFTNKTSRKQLFVGTDAGLNRLAFRADEAGVFLPSFIAGNGTTNVTINTLVDAPSGSRVRTAGTYTTTEAQQATNGQVGAVSATGYVSAGDFTSFFFGTQSPGAVAGQLWIRQVIYWPIRLPSESLVALTEDISFTHNLGRLLARPLVRPVDRPHTEDPS